MTFLERLCALVPRPRRMSLTYHGMLAPAACMRDRVVPPPLPDDEDGGCDHQRRRARSADARSPHTDIPHTADATPGADDGDSPRLGRMFADDDDTAAAGEVCVEPSLLLHLGAAAIQGRTSLGERHGPRPAARARLTAGAVPPRSAVQ